MPKSTLIAECDPLNAAANPEVSEACAATLVRYFHECLGRSTKRPSIKEIGQAAQNTKDSRIRRR